MPRAKRPQKENAWRDSNRKWSEPDRKSESSSRAWRAGGSRSWQDDSSRRGWKSSWQEAKDEEVWDRDKNSWWSERSTEVSQPTGTSSSSNQAVSSGGGGPTDEPQRRPPDYDFGCMLASCGLSSFQHDFRMHGAHNVDEAFRLSESTLQSPPPAGIGLSNEQMKEFKEALWKYLKTPAETSTGSGQTLTSMPPPLPRRSALRHTAVSTNIVPVTPCPQEELRQPERDWGWWSENQDREFPRHVYFQIPRPWLRVRSKKDPSDVYFFHAVTQQTTFNFSDVYQSALPTSVEDWQAFQRNFANFGLDATAQKLLSEGFIRCVSKSFRGQIYYWATTSLGHSLVAWPQPDASWTYYADSNAISEGDFLSGWAQDRLARMHFVSGSPASQPAPVTSGQIHRIPGTPGSLQAGQIPRIPGTPGSLQAGQVHRIPSTPGFMIPGHERLPGTPAAGYDCFAGAPAAGLAPQTLCQPGQHAHHYQGSILHMGQMSAGMIPLLQALSSPGPATIGGIALAPSPGTELKQEETGSVFSAAPARTEIKQEATGATSSEPFAGRELKKEVTGKATSADFAASASGPQDQSFKESSTSASSGRKPSKPSTSDTKPRELGSKGKVSRRKIISENTEPLGIDQPGAYAFAAQESTGIASHGIYAIEATRSAESTELAPPVSDSSVDETQKKRLPKPRAAITESK